VKDMISLCYLFEILYGNRQEWKEKLGDTARKYYDASRTPGLDDDSSSKLKSMGRRAFSLHDQVSWGSGARKNAVPVDRKSVV
jgi:hypothetical protein